MPCSFCGREDPLPFRCNYCGQQFCAEHRLPEQHSCSEYWRVRLPRQEPRAQPTATPTPGYSTGYEFFVGPPYAPARRSIRFSPTELRHIAAGTALVSVSGASIFGGELFPSWITITVAVVFFAMGFILHELAHKFVAQNYGLWAEFRLDMFGAILTLITAVSPFFKIIAPGAVMIAGPTSKRAVGLTSVAGPLTNIVLAVMMFSLSLKVGSPLAAAARAGAAINAFMALFNLLPFGPLDGKKIFWWDKAAWAAALAASIVLTAYLNFGLFR